MNRSRSVFLVLVGSAGFGALVVAACSSDYEVSPDFCARNPGHSECPPALLGGSGGSAGSGTNGQGAGGSAGQGVSGTGGSSGASGSGGGGPTPMGCKTSEQPDDTKGVFVDAAVRPGEGAGTRAEPYGSLTSAVSALAGRAGASIYLRQSETPYLVAATLALPALTEGLVLDGGWGEGWQRDCSAEAATKTLVRGETAAASPVLSAEGGTLTLHRLTVQTVDQAPEPMGKEQSGASLTALRVGGDTALLIEAAVLQAGSASGGTAPIATQPVTGVRACNGLTDCQSGTSVTTPGATGGTNVVQLTSGGFTPGDGQEGQPGGDGQNGTQGGEGVEDPLCKACDGNSQATCEAPNNLPIADVDSADGRCGCGGKGGAPGRGGKGGGASVALWVGSASVRATISGSQVVTGNGGSGTIGGGAVNGTNGLTGSPGETLCSKLTTGSACKWSDDGNVCVPTPSNSASNDVIGPAGGNGGNGGPGGPGGPGAGGPSYAIVKPAAANVAVDATSTLTTGQGGLSGDGAARAESAPQKTY